MTGTSRWLLVLANSSVAVDQAAVGTVEPSSTTDPAPWLPVLAPEHRPASAGDRRVLALVGGRRFEVPANVRMTEIPKLLAPPELLRRSMAALGLIGLAELPAGLTLVCDPRRIATLEGAPP